MIFQQLEGVLKSEGLAAMETVGQPFNPEYHQAIMQVESEEHEEGIVTEEVQKGYLLKDKVLRPAMVKVSM
ncbi:heat shock protein GrpE [compost metagenome]